jgi:hypothetical protein
MLIVNFSHPLTLEQRTQIEQLTGVAIDRIVDVKMQFDPAGSFLQQTKAALDKCGVTSTQWQTARLLVNPPSFAPIACLLLAELHGRMGFFPTILRLRPQPGAVPPVFEVAELLALQEVRDTARQTRS